MAEQAQIPDGNPFEGPSQDDSKAFFNVLDDNLNIQKELPTPTPEQVTSQNVNPDVAGNQGNDESLEARLKRAEDGWAGSSTEAKRLKAEYDKLQPFKSVINFLKEDSGAVEHLQNYLKDGGEVPKSTRDQLNLDDDFVFESNDMDNPDTDTGKLVEHLVDGRAKKIVNETLQQERQRVVTAQHRQTLSNERAAFMQKMNFNDEQMKALEDQAGQRKLTYDDMYLLLNQNQVNQNVAQATQNDMLNQMKAVRDIPTSIGGTNNAGQGMTSEEQAFNSIFGDQMSETENPF